MPCLACGPLGQASALPLRVRAVPAEPGRSVRPRRLEAFSSRRWPAQSEGVHSLCSDGMAGPDLQAVFAAILARFDHAPVCLHACTPTPRLRRSQVRNTRNTCEDRGAQAVHTPKRIGRAQWEPSSVQRESAHAYPPHLSAARQRCLRRHSFELWTQSVRSERTLSKFKRTCRAFERYIWSAAPIGPHCPPQAVPGVLEPVRMRPAARRSCGQSPTAACTAMPLFAHSGRTRSQSGFPRSMRACIATQEPCPCFVAHAQLGSARRTTGASSCRR